MNATTCKQDTGSIGMQQRTIHEVQSNLAPCAQHCCSHDEYGTLCMNQYGSNTINGTAESIGVVLVLGAHPPTHNYITTACCRMCSLKKLAGSMVAGRCSGRSWQVQWWHTLLDLTTVSSRSSTEHVRSCKPLPGVNFSSGLALGVLRTHCCGELRALPGGTAPLDCTALQADSSTHT